VSRLKSECAYYVCVSERVLVCVCVSESVFVCVSATEYNVLALLGKGGFGRVFHCRHKRTGEEVAIKVMNKKLQ